MKRCCRRRGPKGSAPRFPEKGEAGKKGPPDFLFPSFIARALLPLMPSVVPSLRTGFRFRFRFLVLVPTIRIG